MKPLFRNLHQVYGAANEPNLLGRRDRSSCGTGPKDETDHLVLRCFRSGFREERLGSVGKRHLNYLAEFIFVNVGGSLRNVKMSRPSKSGMSVGGVLVVCAWGAPRGAETKCKFYRSLYQGGGEPLGCSD